MYIEYQSISSFNIKWSNKTKRPHPVSRSFGSKKNSNSVNAHENRGLIQFLPLLIGQKGPCKEPAWQILTDLKNIIDLVRCPVLPRTPLHTLTLESQSIKFEYKRFSLTLNLNLSTIM